MLEVTFVKNNARSNQLDVHLRKVRQTVKTLADKIHQTSDSDKSNLSFVKLVLFSPV